MKRLVTDDDLSSEPGLRRCGLCAERLVAGEEIDDNASPYVPGVVAHWGCVLDWTYDRAVEAGAVL